MLHWFSTLKFKIVARAVATGVVSALATAHLVLRTTRADIERLLLESHGAERENTASLLANKLDTLQLTLSSVARHTPPEVWNDQSAMQRFLQDNPAVNALFDSVVAAETSGLMMTRLVRGAPTAELRNISERP